MKITTPIRNISTNFIFLLSAIDRIDKMDHKGGGHGKPRFKIEYKKCQRCAARVKLENLEFDKYCPDCWKKLFHADPNDCKSFTQYKRGAMK